MLGSHNKYVLNHDGSFVSITLKTRIFGGAHQHPFQDISKFIVFNIKLSKFK